MYTYPVKEILRVVDADTIDCRISLGFGIDASFRFRLAFINAPEMSTPEGKEAKAFAERWLADNAPLTVQTFKGSQATIGLGDGAFGRWLASLNNPEGVSLATALQEAGFGG